MLPLSVRPAGISSQVKTPDVVVPGLGGPWNSGTALAVPRSVATNRFGGHPGAVSTPEMLEKGLRAARVSFRSVFEVGEARLAIGHFSRPLAEEECRSLKTAWERESPQEVVDFEISPKRVSFLTPLSRVAAMWHSIDRLLAATSSLAKAS